MTNTAKFAKQELDILAATVPDAVVTPFAKEILALCEKFGKSGQSGGSAPFVASVISQTVKKLLLHDPICDVLGHESEWMEIGLEMGSKEPVYQNVRCGGLFKDGSLDAKPHYLDAIVWKGEEEWNTFTGLVYVDEKDFELISSAQYARLPFKPKTFYIDVVQVPIKEEEAIKRNIHYIQDTDDSCYYTVIKDPKQLQKVFKYYDKKQK